MPTTGVSQRPETTVENGREDTENLDAVAMNAELFTRLAKRGLHHAGVNRLGASTGKRDLPGMVAKLLRAEHEEQGHAGRCRVAEEQHRGRSQPRRRRGHDVARSTHDPSEPIDDGHCCAHAAHARAARTVEVVRLNR